VPRGDPAIDPFGLIEPATGMSNLVGCKNI
jgi:hypothetical protein